MYSINNSGWRQELTPYNQYEEERAPDLDSVFAEFMAYHASSKPNHTDYRELTLVSTHSYLWSTYNNYPGNAPFGKNRKLLVE